MQLENGQEIGGIFAIFGEVEEKSGAFCALPWRVDKLEMLGIL